MIRLPNFPMRNQLADVPSADGKPAENAAYDCVPTCLAACIQYYDGKVVAADDLKDATYGQGHVGGGDELRYGPLCKAKYGLVLSHTDLPSASQAIIDGIRANLRAGRPVIVTMHSQWSRLWTQDGGDGLHVGVAYAIDESDAGNLHIMNPWRGFDHVQPVAWWRARLGNGIYPVAKADAGEESKHLPTGATSDDGTLLHWSNGQVSRGGFREKVLADAQTPDGWQGGMALEAEWTGPDGLVRQLYADALLITDLKSPVRMGDMAAVCELAAHLREGKAA